MGTQKDKGISVSSVDFVCKMSHADHADWRRFYSAWGEAKQLAFLRILRRLREKNMSFCLKTETP